MQQPRAAHRRSGARHLPAQDVAGVRGRARLGAALAGADAETQQVLRDYSEALGIAYQIRDDLEDSRPTTRPMTSRLRRAVAAAGARLRQGEGVGPRSRDDARGAARRAERRGSRRRSARCSASSASRIARARCSRPTRNRPSARCRRCRTRASRGSCAASSARSSASRSRAGAVSLRLEMLQVARLAPKQLGESRDLVAAFLRERVNPDGGFQDRAGASDLYYTVFGLDALSRCRKSCPPTQTAAYLRRVRRRRRARLRPPRLPRARLGGAAPPARRRRSSIACSRASKRVAAPTAATRRRRARARQRLRARSSRSARIRTSAARCPTPTACSTSLRGVARGGRQLRAIIPGCRQASRPATAAAVIVLRHLDAPPDRDAGMWLLDRCHARRRLLRVAADARAGSALHRDRAARARRRCTCRSAGLREPCLDFVDSLWTNRGGFFGTWADDAVDCEYTLLRPARARASEPRTVVTAIDVRELDRRAATRSPAACSIAARLPITGTAIWRAARSRRRPPCSRSTSAARNGCADGEPSRAVRAGRHALAAFAHQNADGGWGDTVRSRSNISTTAIVWATLSSRSRRGDEPTRRRSTDRDGVAAARRGRRHARRASRRHPAPLRQGPDVLGADPHRARADRQARATTPGGLAARCRSSRSSWPRCRTVVSASPAAGRELRAAGADRDRAGPAPLRAVAQSADARAARPRSARDALACCARCSPRAAAISKPRRSPASS